ncbi:type II secretion system F family protein [Roseomonas xinghualingensis]|uniref:type II secretion system F family protein n=1 Tax=Roseomonas xinghualingensis TaxID=2986475 RepID=UPI0021F12C0B|nr:type II secretion system F family protein [Roseomonas sp. SXEYE001]MCV4208697.1 type II secretion system F family protein [Roseomonas sp. SXEYE001]
MAAMLCAAAALVVRGGAQARLRARIRGAGALPVAAMPAAAHPNIRVVQRSQNPLLRRVLRLVAYNPDNPAEHSIPWPLVLLAGIAAGLLGYSRIDSYLGPAIGTAGGLATAALTIRSLFLWQSRRYTGALFRQLPDALGIIVRSLRAGLPMTEALRSVAREMPSPTREAFGRIVGEIAIGRPAETALWTLYERTRLAEYAFFSVMIGLQAQTGGSLTGSLDTLADMVRKRVAMRSRARALASEARMSALILGVLPFLAGLGLSFLQPGYLNIFFNTPMGQGLLMTALTLLGMGMLTIRWLIHKNTSE